MWLPDSDGVEMYLVVYSIYLLCSGWQFNWLFGRLNHGLNHGLNHFTVLDDDLGHDLGGQITN